MKRNLFALSTAAFLYVAAAAPASGAFWSGLPDTGGGWRNPTWFGWINTSGNPWIYHQQHGWMLPLGENAAVGLWFWTTDQGWLWTSSRAYPWLYKPAELTWICYQRGSRPRWFYHNRMAAWYSPDTGRNNTGYTVLFQDAFNSFSSGRWSSTGTPELDRSTGFPHAPSLDPKGRITAFSSSWPAAGGLQIGFRLNLGDQTHAGYITAYINDDSNGIFNATLKVYGSAWSGGPAVSYKMTSPAGPSLSHTENLTAAYIRRRFMDFMFTVHPDGTFDWSRDGVRIQSGPVPLTTEKLRLWIEGGGYVDDVIVRKPR